MIIEAKHSQWTKSSTQTHEPFKIILNEEIYLVKFGEMLIEPMKKIASHESIKIMRTATNKRARPDAEVRFN